jgi:inosine/xanthosine triphosphatase
MKIVIATLNKAKVEALKEILSGYPALSDAEIIPVSAQSEVAEQPLSLEETIKGAKNRAKNAILLESVDYSFGIESGLINIPDCRSAYMDICVASIFDGQQFFYGFSSAWEVPSSVMNFILSGKSMSQAALAVGLTDNPEIGSGEGLVGIVTKGRLDRKAYTKEAIRNALINIDK